MDKLVVEMEYRGSIVPHVRVGRERWTPRAKRYRASQDSIAWALKEQAREMGIPAGGLDGKWSLSAEFYRSAALGDLDNLLKALADAGNGIIWADDRQIIHIEAWLNKCKKGDDSLKMQARRATVLAAERR